MTRCFIASPWTQIPEHKQEELLRLLQERFLSHEMRMDFDGVVARRTDRNQFIASIRTSIDDVISYGIRYAAIDTDVSPPAIIRQGDWFTVERIILRDHYASEL